MKRKKAALRTASVILCVFMLMFCLTGCKYSPKLHEMIQDRFNHLLDTQSAKEFENDFNRIETSDEITAKERNEESERKKDEEKSKPVESEEPQQENPQTTPKTILGSSGETQASASSVKNKNAAAPSTAKQSRLSGNVGDTIVTSGGTSTNGSGTGSSSGGTGQGTGGEGTGGEGSGGTGEQGTEVVPGSGEGRPVVDNRGDLENVPEEVASVACTGTAASFFCAAGGEGLIKASSENFASSPYLDSAVGSQIQRLWSGDGTGMMTNEGFASLISLKPEVVVEISGFSTLSEEQIDQLKANEISYIVLPSPDDLDNIKMAIRLAGKMTGKGGRSGDGNALASQYSSYVDNLISDLQSRVRGSGFADLNRSERYNGKCSLYIEGWDPDARYSIGVIAGEGVAYTGNNMTKSFQLMNSLMDIAGVYNKMNVVEDVRGNELWVTPVKNNGTDKLNVTTGSRTLKKTTQSLLELDSRHLMGTETVPGIIVHDQSTADMLQADRLWQPGTLVGASGMEVNGIYTNADETAFAGSSIEGSFQTFVNPSGLSSWDGLSAGGSWVGGSPESILESAWIASCFYENSYSRGDLENEVRDFYSQFYGVSLSSDQVGAILAGRTG